MFINLKRCSVVLFFLILSSCALFEQSSDDALSEFEITPTNYYGKPLTGLVKFKSNVETPIWYSASGMLKFDGVSTNDSVTNDSVLIYYTDIPYVHTVIKDTSGKDIVTTKLREKDTITIRFYHDNSEYIATKEIVLKNFKPVIDSFVVSNGIYMEFGSSKRVASFLIGSGSGKIKCYSNNFSDDSTSIYWHSNSESIAEQRLMNYLPFEFDIPQEEDNVMLYADVINKNGAVRKDSIYVTIYKERGSVWVLDESPNLYKFSSLGGAIAQIKNVNATDLVYLENTNSLVIQSFQNLSRYYTTGVKYPFATNTELMGVLTLNKFDNDLYLSAMTDSASYLKKYNDEGVFLTYKVKYAGQVTHFIKSKDLYVFSEEKSDSCVLHIQNAGVIEHTESGFLRIKQLDKFSAKDYIVALDDILNKVTVFDLNTKTVVGNIFGFKGKPVCMTVNEITGILYIVDGSSNLVQINLNSMAGDIGIGSVATTEFGFDLPSFIDVNEYSDSDGSASVWICDTHNDRIVKQNSSGVTTVEINGFFHLPKKLVINKGL